MDEIWKNIDFLQKELGSKIKISGYKEKELNNKIWRMNEKLKELERKSELDSNYFYKKVLEIIPFVIETEGRVTNLEEYMRKLEEYFTN
jgi:hypothetical protein